MKKFIFLTCLLSSVSVFANSNDKYIIEKTSSPPIIDGDLSEWDNISNVSFSVHNTGLEGSTSGTAKAVWTNDAVFFAFSIKDVDVMNTYFSKDDPLYNNDDLIEIFLDFDGDGKDYVEIGVSAANINYDLTVCPSVICGSWGGSGLSGWDIVGLETEAIVIGTLNNSSDVDEGYTIEVKIPFSGLSSAPGSNFEIPTNGSTWRGNLYTIDYSTGAAKDAANDYLSWSTLPAFGFHQPNDFATFEFVDLLNSKDATLELPAITFLGGNKWSVSNKEILDVSLFDLFGKEIQITRGDTDIINLSTFSKGIYLLVVEAKEGISIHKVLVK